MNIVKHVRMTLLGLVTLSILTACDVPLTPTDYDDEPETLTVQVRISTGGSSWKQYKRAETVYMTLEDWEKLPRVRHYESNFEYNRGDRAYCHRRYASKYPLQKDDQDFCVEEYPYGAIALICDPVHPQELGGWGGVVYRVNAVPNLCDQVFQKKKKNRWRGRRRW